MPKTHKNRMTYTDQCVAWFDYQKQQNRYPDLNIISCKKTFVEKAKNWFSGKVGKNESSKV